MQVLLDHLHVRGAEAMKVQPVPGAAGDAARVVRLYVLPGARRRVVLLLCATLVGATLGASGVPRVPVGNILLVGLAVLAGISSMWSP